jgi:hypothetical protein
MIEMTNSAKKTKNRIFAIEIDAPAMEVNPSTPAMIAMTINTNEYSNIYLINKKPHSTCHDV